MHACVKACRRPSAEACDPPCRGPCGGMRRGVNSFLGTSFIPSRPARCHRLADGTRRPLGRHPARHARDQTGAREPEHAGWAARSSSTDDPGDVRGTPARMAVCFGRSRRPGEVRGWIMCHGSTEGFRTWVCRERCRHGLASARDQGGRAEHNSAHTSNLAHDLL